MIQALRRYIPAVNTTALSVSQDVRPMQTSCDFVASKPVRHFAKPGEFTLPTFDLVERSISLLKRCIYF